MPSAQSRFKIRPLLGLLLLVLLLPDVLLVEALAAIPIFFDSSNTLHRDIQYHPETPERITVCVQALDTYQKQQAEATIQLSDVAPDVAENSTIRKEHRPFSELELSHARDILLQTHQPALVTRLEERCRSSRQKRMEDGKAALGYIGRIDEDTYITTETFDVCLRATAAWIRSVDIALDSTTGSSSSLALTRPPGHHATYALQNGFCLYNFAAAAAIHAVKRGKRVSILDWDVHYGQGVANIVHGYENIRYVSIHQTPAFPYEGEQAETVGNCMTLPMPPETTWTCGYKDLFQKAIQFCSSGQEWQPDLVIVCAGYDGLSNDSLASCNLNAKDYGRMAKRLCQHLIEQASGNNEKRPAVMLGLEGGYCIRDGGQSGNLPDAVVETIQALVELDF